LKSGFVRELALQSLPLAALGLEQFRDFLQVLGCFADLFLDGDVLPGSLAGVILLLGTRGRPAEHRIVVSASSASATSSSSFIWTVLLAASSIDFGDSVLPVLAVAEFMAVPFRFVGPWPSDRAQTRHHTAARAMPL
jgi:hypothetical protein